LPTAELTLEGEADEQLSLGDHAAGDDEKPEAEAGSESQSEGDAAEGAEPRSETSEGDSEVEDEDGEDVVKMGEEEE